MTPRAWLEFLGLMTLSAAVAIYGTPEVGPVALIIALAGAATAVFGAIRDRNTP